MTSSKHDSIEQKRIPTTIAKAGANISNKTHLAGDDGRAGALSADV